MSSEPSQTSKMELFAKTINDFYPLTIFAKSSVLEMFDWVLLCATSHYIIHCKNSTNSWPV